MWIRVNDGDSGSGSGGGSGSGKNGGIWGGLIFEGDGSVGSVVCGVDVHISAFMF